MSRAALLPTPGDPFVLDYWARNCREVWRHEVDDLYVLLNGPQDAAVLARNTALLEDLGARVLVDDARLGHGEALGRLLEICDTMHVVLLEDDAYVREQGALDEAFALLEDDEADVLGTSRGGMDPRVQALAEARWGRASTPNGGDGPGLWPCFLFAWRSDLLATSRQFAARAWQPGEVIPGLEHVVEPPDTLTTDTLTVTAFELRAIELRHRYHVQHKELWHKELPPEGAPWFHVGGLSNQPGAARADIGGTLEGRDWAHRIWWWGHCFASSSAFRPDDHLARPDMRRRDTYRQELKRLIDLTGTADDVNAWTGTLTPWITWRDWA